jgi:hypothetical protein
MPYAEWMGYGHLSFTTNHPMAHLAQKDGRIRDLVWLHINPEIVQVKGALSTIGVSNKKGMAPISVAEALDGLDLEIIYDRPTGVLARTRSGFALQKSLNC